MDRPLTKPQVSFLTNAMRRPVTLYGSGNYRTAGSLKRQSLIAEAGHSDLSHGVLYRPTALGLKALLDYRSRRYAKSGCIAYLRDMQEVEAAIKAAA